jgi:hypothetical protein
VRPTGTPTSQLIEQRILTGDARALLIRWDVAVNISDYYVHAALSAAQMGKLYSLE